MMAQRGWTLCHSAPTSEHQLLSYIVNNPVQFPSGPQLAHNAYEGKGGSRVVEIHFIRDAERQLILNKCFTVTAYHLILLCILLFLPITYNYQSILFRCMVNFFWGACIKAFDFFLF